MLTIDDGSWPTGHIDTIIYIFLKATPVQIFVFIKYNIIIIYAEGCKRFFNSKNKALMLTSRLNQCPFLCSSSRTTYKSAFPEWYVHEENTYKHELDTPSKKKRQIIAFDDMSYWKRFEISQIKYVILCYQN